MASRELQFETYHMPSEIMQTDLSSQSKVDCDKFVANAAVCGDCFQWHVDSDPWTIDESTPWAKTYGVYFNGVDTLNVRQFREYNYRRKGDHCW